MIRYSWLPVLLRAIGVLVVGLSIPGVVTLVAQLISMSFSSGQRDLSWFFLGLIPSAVQCALGLYLVFGGRWIAHRCLYGVDRICPACGYDVADPSVEVCPERGMRVRAPSPPPRAESR